MTVDIAVPAILRFGRGSLSQAAEVVRLVGVQRPLVVADGYLQQTGQLGRVVSELEAGGLDVAVVADTVPDPTTDSLLPGLRAVAAHRADGIVGFGGGSPMDTAKALAVLAAGSEPMRSFKAPVSYAGPALPVVAIPTTAGSGSEATKFTVITDSETGEKMLCAGPSFLPRAAIIDPDFTVSMPARLTADTGLDALTHAVEAHVSAKANFFSDALSLAAMRRIGATIRRVYKDGEDVEAREAMMTASTQAGIAFSNASVALIHGMSRPIGAHFHIAHGLSNAMLFPVVTRFSLDAGRERYAACARALKVATDTDSDRRAAAAFLDEITSLCRELDVPTPAGHGIDQHEWERLIPTMATQALASGSPANNPIVPSASAIAELYAEAFGA